MTSQVLFNQFAYVDRLKAGGFTDEQARASADALGAALSDTVATSSELTAAETRLGIRIDNLEAKIEVSVARLEATLIKWFVGIALTMTGLISTAVWAIVKFAH
ncbi:MAG TPA: hypothetical protein VMU78_09335 [Methylocella sp.]|nr:hypothetical protein [Methylocella sp.]